MANNKAIEAYKKGKAARSKTKSHYGQVSSKTKQNTVKKKKKKEEPERTQTNKPSGGTANHRGAAKSNNKNTNSTGNQRREGAQRARQNSTAKKIGNVATGAVITPVKSYGYHTAKNATDAAGWASKNAFRASVTSARNRPHASTKNDRKNETQKTQTTDFYKKQKEAKAKTQSADFKAKQKAYTEPFKETGKKLVKAQDKELEKGAKALGLSDEKKYKVPKNKLLNKFVAEGTEFSATDIYKTSNKAADELADYLIPYGGTTKASLKAAEGILKLGKGGKALTSLGEATAKGLSSGGKKFVREAVKDGIKNGDDMGKILKDVSKKVAKSDFKQNVKKELLANAIQDATLGTTIDALKGRQQGLKGDEFKKYMAENAVMNAAFGMPISMLAGRTGKAGKNALNNEIKTLASDTVKATTEESRLARRLGAKGLSPDEVQKAISKPEVQEYINLSVKEGKTGLTKEQKSHLDRLSAKVEAQRQAYDDAINESVKITRASIGEASAIDVSRLGRAVTHYETTGNKAAAKEARQLLAKAEKNFEKTLDTVQKASAKVSNDLGREFKIESADDCLTAFANTGGRVDDPSKFHGFAEFDKDGNIVAYHVNKDSEQALEYTFGHEFMHGFESLGKEYDDFVKDLKDYVGDEWTEALEKAEKDYANVANADFEKEAVANLVAKHFFAEDGAYLKKLAGENPNLFARIYEAIKRLISGASESDTQFKALSKQLDDMFDSLSAHNKSIITGSPDTTRLLYGGEGSIADGLASNPKIRGGEELKDKVKDIDATYKNAISELNKAKAEFADDPMQMAVARETIRKQLVEDLSINMAYAKDKVARAEKKFGDNYKAIEKVRKEVYKETGCFQTLSGDWGYLIDDRNMKYLASNKIRPLQEAQKRGDMLGYDPKSDKILPNPKAYDKANNRIKEIDREYHKSRTGKKRKEELRKEFETLTHKTNLYRAFVSEDGVPLGEVIDHELLYLLYPEAKTNLNIKFKNINDGTGGAYIKGDANNPSKIIINAKLLADDSLLAKGLSAIQNIDVNIEKRTSVIHELQHALQGNEGRPGGGGSEEFLDAYKHIYPKVYDRDREKLADIVLHRDAVGNEITKDSYQYSGEADAAIAKYWDYIRNESTNLENFDGVDNIVEQFRLMYPDASDAEIKQLYIDDVMDVLQNDTVVIGSKKLGNIRHDPVDIKPFEKKLREFVSADYDAALLSETNASTLYKQLSGEVEARSAQNIGYNTSDREAINKILDDTDKVLSDINDINPSVSLELASGTGLWQRFVKTIDYDNIKNTMSREEFVQKAFASMKADHGGDLLFSNKKIEPLVKDFIGLQYDKSGLKWYGKLKNKGELMNSYPVEFGENVRYKGNTSNQVTNHNWAKATDPSNKKIDKIAPNRLTRNESGLSRLEYPELTRRSQTMSESESAYYESLAADVETAEKEFQNAKDAYTFSEPKPKAEKPKNEQPATQEKKGMIERERRDDTKKRENETAKRAFKTLNKEYEGEKGWVDAVTGKRENGAFGKLKTKGLKEAENTAKKELADGGYDKLKQKYFVSDFSEDPNLMMARANELLSEIDRKVKAGDGNEAELFDEACDVMEKYSGITTLGANILNAAKKFMTSTPQGRKRVVYKEIERLEKRYKDRIKDGKIIPPEDKIEELVNATGAKADDLLDEINKEIWEQIPASLMERLNEVRHCFMLFNIKTHGRNVLGNSVFRLARAFSDNLERRILNSEKARKRIGSMQGGKNPSDVIINRQKVTHKELKDNYMYLFNEFHAIYDKSGSRNKFIETGRPDGVPTMKLKAMQKLIDFNYKWLEKEDLKGALIPAFNKSYLGYCRARCPEGTDLRKFMENMTPAQKEKARQYALAQGEYATFRDSCAFSDWLTAKKTMFAGQKGKTKWGTFGYRALDAVLEGAIPFVKTPVNIFRRSVDYSPASIVMSLGKLAKADSPEMFQLGVHQFCTGLTGTGMAGFGVLLAQHGLITVKVGEESGDAYYDRELGYQDYSVKVDTTKLNKGINWLADKVVPQLGIHLNDGKEYSWTLDWMSPMNMSLFAGAAFEKATGDSFRAMLESLEGKNDKGALKAFVDELDNQSALNAFFAITSPMTDMSFMSSPKDTMERFLENASRGTDGKETDFAGALAQLIVGDIPKNYVSGFFPQLTAQFAGAKDDYRRDTKSTRENVYLRGWESSYRQLVNKIPWAREYLLNPKVNRRGEDVKNDENIATRLLNSFINPANVKEITTNEQDRELINIRNHMDKNSDDYTYFYYNFTGNPPYNLANGKRMTYDESYKYAKASRSEMNFDIENMLGAESYQDMSWDMKANEVKGTYWIGKSVADKEVYGLKYAMKVLKNDDKRKGDYSIWETYKDNAGGSASGNTFWNYYIDKERMYNRSHPNGDNTYRVKGLPAIQSGDQALIDAVGLEGQKEPELKHYWELVQKKFGKIAKTQANKEISDGVCIMTTNIDKAGVESANLGMQSASAGVSAKNGKQLEERVYRALGQFWNSAQAGGGLMLKYNTDGKYDLKNLEKIGNKLTKKLDSRPDGSSQKDVVCDFIENDLGVTDVDEAACLYQVLYAQGHSNPASKTCWKNPYKDKIDDHLKWGDNKDGEWGGLEKGSGGRGWGRHGWGHGGGGSGGGGASFTPEVNTAGGAAKQTITKVKTSNPFGTSNTSKESTLNEAYRRRVKKLRQKTHK